MLVKTPISQSNHYIKLVLRPSREVIEEVVIEETVVWDMYRISNDSEISSLPESTQLEEDSDQTTNAEVVNNSQTSRREVAQRTTTNQIGWINIDKRLAPSPFVNIEVLASSNTFMRVKLENSETYIRVNNSWPGKYQFTVPRGEMITIIATKMQGDKKMMATRKFSAETRIIDDLGFKEYSGDSMGEKILSMLK